MLVRIDVGPGGPLGPLAILPELPDARLAMIEGLNGVGKSLAVRLLLACTGVNPYPRASASWFSLCEGLGPFTLTITNLRGAQQIRWVADSRDWLALGSDDPPTFHELSIDGRAADLPAVRQLLAVYRIAGDEGILDTLANQASDEAERVNRWARGVAGPTSGPLVTLEAAVHDALTALGEVTTATYAQLQRDLVDAQTSLDTSSSRANELRTRSDALREASEIASRLATLRQRTPGLAARLTQLDRDLAEARRSSADAAERVARLAGKVAGAAKFTRELNLARRNLERHRKRLSDETLRGSAAAAPLNIEARADVVTSRRDELNEQLSALLAEQLTLDTAPVMRGVLETLVGHLTMAEGRGLSDQVAVEDAETGLALTVRQTRVGMQTRRGILEGQPPPPEAERLGREIHRVRRDLARVDELLTILGNVGRYRQLVDRAEQRLDIALANTDPKAAAQLHALEEQRRRSEEQVLTLAAERAALVQQLGGDTDSSVEALTGQLNQQLAALDLTDTAQLADMSGQAQRDTSDAEYAVANARENVTRIRRDLARADADVQRALSAVRTSPRLGWLRDGNALTAAPATTTTQALQVLDPLREVATQVQDRLAGHRAQLGAVVQALRGIASQLRGEDLRADTYVRELQTWFGAQYSEWFSNPTIRKELLPDATGDIVVDLPTAQVQWTEAGIGRTRPLEAFSSGEQAFAYTRARLGTLDDQAARPANRLLVLDEFGAFIAHDRFGALLAYLQQRADTHPEDQVLVILPLSRNYAQLAEATFGDEAAHFAALADQVRTQRYATQVLGA